MAKKLTGMDIFKLLPKTNCGECGVPTCMAFAMKLAQKSAELSACPSASDEAKTVIGAASEPPIRLVKFGAAGRAVEMGNELVMFRHEKTFVHGTAIAVRIDSSRSREDSSATAKRIETYAVERAGEQLAIESLLIDDTGGDFRETVLAAACNFGGALILKSDDPERLKQAAVAIIDRVPLLHAITRGSLGALLPFVREKKIPVVISAPTADDAFSLCEQVVAAGHRDIVLDITGQTASLQVQNNTAARKSALAAAVKPLGYPLMNFATGRANVFDTIADAAGFICKYASLLVIDRCEPEALLPLVMLRQNIYTDPQKPIQVEPTIHVIGAPTPSSPLLVTTNFSLTYFIVSGEAEGAGVPAYLAVVDAEGMSVLTAWAAGKFSPEKIAAFIKAQEITPSIASKTLVLPGYVSTLSGELEEKMEGWKVLVGPQEASDIGPFMKRFC